MKNEESLRWGNAGKDTANGDNSSTTCFLGDPHLEIHQEHKNGAYGVSSFKKCQCVHTQDRWKAKESSRTQIHSTTDRHQKGMVDLSLNRIKHNLFIGVKWQRMWCSELASCVWLNALPSYGMSSVCDLGPAKVKSRLTSVCTSGISEPTLQWGLISIMSLHLQSQNRPPNTKLLKPYTSVCITIFVVAVWWLVSVWD